MLKSETTAVKLCRHGLPCLFTSIQNAVEWLRFAHLTGTGYPQRVQSSKALNALENRVKLKNSLKEWGFNISFQGSDCPLFRKIFFKKFYPYLYFFV